jgi:protein-S-isoprenylcysteine O-methyltransferase Ste14
MIDIIILIITSLLFLMVLVMIVEAMVKKTQIFGRPSIPIVFFIMAKIFPFIILIFLFLKGLHVQIPTIIDFPEIVDYLALILLFSGLTLAELTSFKLKKDLVFGLSDSKSHQLQTNGVYSISRHPFYMGFLLILISSVLFVPNIFNILLLVISWILHHLIMIKEEEFLTSKYGDEYKEYSKKVNRYITIFKK